MTLGFIGIGRIASAVVSGLCTSKIKNIIINLSPRNNHISTNLSETFANVHRRESNQLVLDNSEIIFIAIPPKGSKEILKNMKFKKSHIVISLIPFLVHSELTKVLSPAGNISRAVPLPTVMDHNCPIPIFNSNATVTAIFNNIGQPVLVEDEDQLHALWTLTGLIAPFYDLLNELSGWSKSKGVNGKIADRYIVDMFNSLTFSAGRKDQIDFYKLTKHATTPNGMNEQATKEIKDKRVHEAYTAAADNLLKRFGREFAYLSGQTSRD